MFVHQFNRHCNCCNKLVESSYKDIPIGEINLSPFPVPCDCGYFYVAEHHTVSYSKWNLAKAIIKDKLGYAQSDYKREKEFTDTLETPSASRLIALDTLKNKVIDLHAKWDDISLTPIPDHLWVEKD